MYIKNILTIQRCTQGLKNREISVIGWHRNDNRHQLSIDGKIGKISDISAKYRWSTDKLGKKLRVEAHAEKPEEEPKKSAILPIYRWFFQKIDDFLPRKSRLIADFFAASRILIWQPNLNFWGSDGPDFTRVFVKASNGQICDPMMENQSSLYPRAMECFQRLYEDLMVKFEPNFDPTIKINL